MISVLIADDEYLLRQLIRNSIQWDELDMEVVGEAEDGEKALEFIRQQRPDIAIIDINMPFINGIELARIIYTQKIETRMLILTGYREFEYAQKAVTYKVFDYLLKPIKSEEMTVVLQNMGSEIKKDRINSNMLKMMLDQESAARKLSSQKLVRSMAHGKMSEIDRESVSNLLSIEDGKINALLVQIEHIEQGNNDVTTAMMVLLEAAEKSFEECGFTHVNGYIEEDAYVVVFVNSSWDEIETRSRLKRCANKLRARIKEQYSFTVSIGISDTVQGYSNMSAALDQTINALTARFYQDQDNTFCAWEESGQIGEGEYEAAALQLIDFQEMLQRPDWVKDTDSTGRLRDAFDAMRERGLSEDFVKMSALSFISALYSLGAVNIPANSFVRGRSSIVDKIIRCKSFIAVQNIVLGIFEDYRANLLENIHVVRFSKLVEEAKKYIEKNYYSPDLSLNKIAAAVYANPTYVSNQFKKEFNITITEYITTCRMKAAVKIIGGHSHVNLAEIATRVGYRDPYYFSKSFKKYYGITPSRYQTGE